MRIFKYNGGKFSFAKKETTIEKSAAATAVLRKLRSFLDSAEPTLVYFLVRIWNGESKAITYKELREAILAGDIPWVVMDALLEEWRDDYAKFIVNHLQDAWVEAMRAAVADMEAEYPEWYFDPFASGVQEWAETRAAEFVTNVTSTQIDGLRAIIKRAASLEDMSVDQLARAIRPMVGLTRQQGVANLNYYNNLIASGMKEEKAMDLSARYAARQHRYRGYNIARTELAFAYNKGADAGIRQAQAAGYMGEVVKVWSTADDERVCKTCGGLEGKVVAMDEDFDFYTKLAATNPGIRQTPPAHPGCRCAVEYREIPKTRRKP